MDFRVIRHAEISQNTTARSVPQPRHGVARLEEEVKFMFCPYCGKQIDDGSKHCQYCGKGSNTGRIRSCTCTGSRTHTLTCTGSCTHSR